jgi:hypothetical protein
VAGAKGIVKGVKPASGQQAVVYAAARKHGVPPAILWGVYGAETNFGRNTNVSSAGAQGPFQFMPGTARSLGVDPHNFKSAAYGAAKYLRSLYHGDWKAAVGHYNSGPAGNLTNSQTAAYIPRVFQLAKTFGGGQKLTKAQARAFKIIEKSQPRRFQTPGPSNTSGVPVSTSSPGVSAGVASGKASGGKASALSGLPAADAAALAQLWLPSRGRCWLRLFRRRRSRRGRCSRVGTRLGQVSLADILQRITGRARV